MTPAQATAEKPPASGPKAGSKPDRKPYPKDDPGVVSESRIRFRYSTRAANTTTSHRCPEHLELLTRLTDRMNKVLGMAEKVLRTLEQIARRAT